MTDQESASLIEMKALVVEIAHESPIRVDDYSGTRNLCRYCEVSWAEREWEQYVRNAEGIAQNPDVFITGTPTKVASEHHHSDCLWVRANKVIRGL